MTLLFTIFALFIVFVVIYILYIVNQYTLEQTKSQYLDDTIQGNIDYELQESDVQQTKT